jgi:UDP-glucose 4-epimerase
VARVLLTGAAGFIGGRLLRHLATAHEVFGLDRTPPPDNLPAQGHWLDVDLVKPLDGAGLPAKLDAVVHLAQSRAYRDFPEGAADVFGVNVHGTFRLLEYARAAGAQRFIFTSSGGVYGTSYEKFVESDPVSPLNFYLSSKYAAELLLANYQRFFRTVVVRPFFVYGVGQNEGMLVPRLVRSVASGAPIVLQGPDGIRINPLHVSDAVAALSKALEIDGNHLVNIAGPEVLTMRQIGEIIGGHLGRRPVFEQRAADQPSHLVGDIGKMSELLVPPGVKFADGVKELCLAVRNATRPEGPAQR